MVVEANSTRNTCHIVVDKVNLNLEEVGRKFHDGNNCQDSCSGDFEDPGDCDWVAYAGAIRAQWTAEPKTSFSLPPQDSEDPSAQGDLWMCESCGCADPASPSLFQVAQVGCAVTGMNPLDPADRAIGLQSGLRRSGLRARPELPDRRLSGAGRGGGRRGARGGTQRLYAGSARQSTA